MATNNATKMATAAPMCSLPQTVYTSTITTRGAGALLEALMMSNTHSTPPPDSAIAFMEGLGQAVSCPFAFNFRGSLGMRGKEPLVFGLQACDERFNQQELSLDNLNTLFSGLVLYGSPGWIGVVCVEKETDAEDRVANALLLAVSSSSCRL